MIKSIRVKNYILIDEVTVEFDKGFNVFTGETGAGKSIIIGAIDSVLGAKSSKDVIKSGADKAYIELTIELREDFDKCELLENGIELFDGEIIISKEITQTSSRYRINGTIVTQDFIKEIREKLLDIHSQHQSYNYVQQKNHILLLDNFALPAHKDNVALFKRKYDEYVEKSKYLEELELKNEKIIQQEDFLKFQIEEIENANIEDVEECEKLEKELSVLSEADRLKEYSYSSYWGLYGDDGNILDSLSSIKGNISKLVQTDESLNEVEENFINAYETLKDVAIQLRDYSESKDNDEERMNEINERLALLDKIKRKYGHTLELVKENYEKLSSELNEISHSQDEGEQVRQELFRLKKELSELAGVISGARKELAKVLSFAVTEELEKLELPKSKFEISVEPCTMNEKGVDRVEFMISTNVSEGVKPLAKTASGGEISRVMLAIKTIFAKADKTNTVIFDEIDTGISGKASQAVADSIVKLSNSHQIILITHQPLIAARANAHFYVKKEQTDVTKVKVYNLDDENRIKAIAMLSAGEINEESEAFAKKLLGVI